MVFAIERCSMHDGPGIRTTVFLKGCPLRCLWCHNPESQSNIAELFFLTEKCALCGACVSTCLNGCHAIKGGKHYIDRSVCKVCGVCTAGCPDTALEIKGFEMSVDEVIEEVEKDREYYNDSDGGLTVSGGEPMLQFDFTSALLAEAKAKKIHTCIETSGYSQTDRFLEIRKFVDIFLIDFKESDPEKHLKYTGVDNSIIRKNINKLDESGAKIILRCPIIPGMNDRKSHFKEIAKLAERLKNIIEINVMAYHPMGESKSKKIGKEYPLKKIGFPEKKTVDKWLEEIARGTKVPVKKG